MTARVHTPLKGKEETHDHTLFGWYRENNLTLLLSIFQKKKESHKHSNFYGDIRDELKPTQQCGDASQHGQQGDQAEDKRRRAGRHGETNHVSLPSPLLLSASILCLHPSSQTGTNGHRDRASVGQT